MECIICGSVSEHFLSKEYTENPYKEFMREIGTVEYYRCTNCGFVSSKTHAELDKEKWITLNCNVHEYFEENLDKDIGNQPPYLEQANLLAILGANGLIDLSNMIDYAAGHGTLSKILKKYFGIHLPIFDPYVIDGDLARYVNENDLSSYSTVINSAMFEHIVRRQDLEKINNLVARNGCLLIHTVVCENIPKNPDWFYFRPPVHTAFHTNRSMAMLMQQWGYEWSVYCPKAKSWVLFRHKMDNLAPISRINKELECQYLVFKNGFVDYWKGL